MLSHSQIILIFITKNKAHFLELKINFQKNNNRKDHKVLIAIRIRKVRNETKVYYEMSENELSKIIFDSTLKVHRNLGSGLLESSYEECLFYELKKVGLFVEKQKPLPFIYEDVKLELGYRIDLLVEKKVVIEIKAVDALNDIHLAQVLTYLKLSNCKLGMLINFNVTLIKNGIKRVVNNL